ncbi:MAG: class I SAM-dependent methyltransferase [Wenzhouxiangellaceae bacterium]
MTAGQQSWLDLFSSVAGDYARYRPHYPAALFDYLISQCPATDHVWDCATGNGQAAIALAERFTRVTATDASADQLSQAPDHPAIEYAVAAAENSGLAGSSVDLVCVAQALHWFDLPAFYREVHRVLRADGILAVWSYAITRAETPAVDEVLQFYYHQTLEPYWLPQRRWVEQGYRQLPFPYSELQPPSLSMEMRMTREQLLGYLNTWSATSRCREATGNEPLQPVNEALLKAWPQNQDQLLISWPLNLRLGRRPADQ